jgi:transcriptional regulator with XRE-family HTH domain
LLGQVFYCWHFIAIMDSDNHQSIQELPTLKALRESVQLTQPELSRRMNVGIRIIGDWERGARTPRFDNALLLARELGVSLKTLARAMRFDVTGIPDD